MVNYNELDVLINKILSELHKLKSKKIEKEHLQDFSVDILQKNKASKNTKKTEYSKKIEKELNNPYSEVTVFSKWFLRRRAKKIFKIKMRIQKGYISGVDKSISTIRKIYLSFLKS